MLQGGLHRAGGTVAQILIVDDDSELLANARRLIEAAGHQATDAESGEQALEMMDESRFDLVIMDVVMPRKGGIEAIMEIHTRHPDIPTVIMSGKVPLGTDAISSLMGRYGARAVLSKPFTGEELLNAVESALNG